MRQKATGYNKMKMEKQQQEKTKKVKITTKIIQKETKICH